MKMDPIKFRLRYSDENTDCWKGFRPYTNKDENYILERHVIVQGSQWNSGSMVSFEIEETYLTKDKSKQRRSLCTRTYYDKDNLETKNLIDNLASDQLRGKVAENTAMALYK